MTLFEELKAAAAQQWADYTGHEFIRRMGRGTLAESAFRNYLIQDYLFLIQFARAHALAAYKAHTVADLDVAGRGLRAALEESELHVRLCSRWGLSRQDLEAAEEHPATVAYTRYVLDTGLRGDLLDIHVALSPCTVGYAEIGARLKLAAEQDPQHPYAEWISEYSAPQFQQLAAEAADTINELGRRFLGTPSANPQRFAALAEIFATATRMESAFWQMALDLGAAEEADRKE
ncbi:thiaminase II [Nesterenkonia sp.]|uniref:thiaminase II n=1 Tax=Nesterenkonia sp. TaxID=704201 RepID=UPI00261FF487|nr:thiaminase II [Nesterenkonia sp.]